MRPVIQCNDPCDFHEDLVEVRQEVLGAYGLKVGVQEGHHVLHHLIQSCHKLAGGHS